MRTHRGKILALVIAAALSVGACGSDEPKLTKSQYIERGNAICAKANQRVEEAARRTFTTPGEIASAELVTEFANEVVAPTIENEVEQLSELRPPEVDEERIEDLLQAGRDGVDRVQEDPTVLLSSVDSGFGRYQELSVAYGLQNCGAASKETRDLIEGTVSQG